MSPDRRHRATRIEVYADWLVDDADGLAFNLAHPIAEPMPNATTILANAKAKLLWAMEQIENAIAADRAAHREKEPAL